MRRPAAYQGRGWRPRTEAMRAELDGVVWAPYRSGSEHGRLKAVFLYKPGPEVAGLRRPNAWQHLAPIELAALRRELAALAAVLRRRGVEVFDLRPAFPGWPVKRNLLYARDLFWMTPEGAVVARMASRVRAGEEKSAAAALAARGAPILRTVSGRGTFEGADALWLDPRTVLVGVGSRTNAEGARQLGEVLNGQGVRVVRVEVPSGVQHLLGLLQIVDRDLALARAERAPRALLSLLARRGVRVVRVPESAEVVERQGLNVVAVAPRRVLMPDDCPALRRLYEGAGLRVEAALDVRQLRRGAGGLACAVGVLSRGD